MLELAPRRIERCESLRLAARRIDAPQAVVSLGVEHGAIRTPIDPEVGIGRQFCRGAASQRHFAQRAPCFEDQPVAVQGENAPAPVPVPAPSVPGIGVIADDPSSRNARCGLPDESVAH